MTAKARPGVPMVVARILPYRRPIVVALHLMVIVIANYLAFDLRFGNPMPPEQFLNFVTMLPWLLVIRSFIFLPCGLYEGMWRYAGIWDLRNIIIAAVLSTGVFAAATRWGFGLSYPRSVFVIDTLILIMLVGGLRLARRVYRQSRGDSGRRILVYGAGDVGELLVRGMLQNRFYGYKPVAFVDDDPAKVGQRIHGLRVLGGRQELARIFKKVAPHAVLLAMPAITPARMREVVAALEPFKVPIKTLPNRNESVEQIDLGQIRNLSVEDLLERAPIGIAGDVGHLITGQRVMVTGAGGSIGSELCRQIAALKPAVLIMYERYENNLYAIANELPIEVAAGVAHAVVGDVTDECLVNTVMSEYRPDIVFHAAAHKHVPLMELNPCEAVKNNVLGTRVTATAAAAHGVRRFILISTDKAVNPSSVMGATKRVAELLLQAMKTPESCVFTAVRFGNVLGSNGSVLPRFLRQIEAGGPVTVTHPEVRRYFMLIPEAVQLVLHAAALGAGGDMFVLEMGEQIKVVDMARNVIRLAGFVPEQEVPITFIGLRPGEKLYEELVGHDETMEQSGVPEIRRVRGRRHADRERILAGVAELEGRALTGDAKAVIEQLREIVPTYRPDDDTGDR
ncbi:MAG TPA: nucleoside-diphosphate sugar epimerase/dehydratase [Vicinamibacterales bacterium]|nr:nucleoside-diphosphate sugar epimerase/dehydratase [Vicinamibacterales bacterium]